MKKDFCFAISCCYRFFISFTCGALSRSQLTLLSLLLSECILSQMLPLIPIEDFLKIPERAKLSVSPNGEYFAYVSDYQGKHNLFIERMIDGEKRRITSYDMCNVHAYHWFNDSIMVIRRDNNGDENYHLYKVNINTLNEQDMTPFKRPNAEEVKILGGELFAVMQDDLGRTGYFSLNPLAEDLPKLNTESLQLANENFVFDQNNHIRMISGISDAGMNVLYYRRNLSESFKLIHSTTIDTQIIPLSFCSNNKDLYCFSNLGRDKFALVVFDPEQAREKEVLFAHDHYDVLDGIEYDKATQKLLYVSYIDWKKQYHFFDEATEAIFKIYFDRFPQSNVDVIGNTRNGKTLLLISSDRNPGEYYFYDSSVNIFQKIGEVNSSIDQSVLARTIPIEYHARDGLLIHGYLTIPLNTELRNLPTVAFAHGGPWTRDSWGYNGYFQFLANRGYLIFYMDFRGSRGYGKNHYVLSFKAWDKMCDDIADGVKWLIQQGISDKDRVAIAGSSWGGFASNYSVIFYPELYRCGLTQCGPANLFTMHKSLINYGSGAKELMETLIGKPDLDSAYFNRISPVLNVEKLERPLLIWQGRNDPRVPWREAQQIYDAATARGIEVELLMKENEGHNIANYENRVEFYQRVEGFLKRYMR